MRYRCFLSVALTTATLALPVAAKGMTRDQLIDLVRKKVDTDVIVALVEKDCVDFEINADTVAVLTEKVPTKVLKAAIECSKVHTSTSGSPSTSPGNAPQSSPTTTTVSRPESVAAPVDSALRITLNLSLGMPMFGGCTIDTKQGRDYLHATIDIGGHTCTAVSSRKGFIAGPDFTGPCVTIAPGSYRVRVWTELNIPAYTSSPPVYDATLTFPSPKNTLRVHKKGSCETSVTLE